MGSLLIHVHVCECVCVVAGGGGGVSGKQLAILKTCGCIHPTGIHF